MRRCENKNVVITGGSSGIGKATAILFAAEGANVIILDINEKMAKETVKEIESTGGSAFFYNVDVSKLETVRKAADKIAKEIGLVDVLINNAGIIADSSLKKMTEEQFDRVLAINLKGVFNCTKVFSEHMIRKSKGSIISASSVVAHHGNFGQTNYVTSKAAVIGMTKGWARELGPRGVRVNALTPGLVDTEMIHKVPDEILSELKERIPLKRFSTTQEIASVYLFLASDKASYVNGSVLAVDGGLVI